MSFEQHLKDLDDIKTMKKDRKTVVRHFIEQMKIKAGLLYNGNEKATGKVKRSLHNSQESERGLEETV